MGDLVAYRSEAAWGLTPTSKAPKALSCPVPEVTPLSVVLLRNTGRLALQPVRGSAVETVSRFRPGAAGHSL